ncbi:hypothetical protein [Bradyrhizobium sp. RT9a]|uniref:hypothetical protein n=1 Tax=Bradyrhizobium sp. RT9a TaxID=3156384 RepID=UPI003395F95C
MCECLTKVNTSLRDRNTKLATGFIFTRDLAGMDCLPLVAVEKVDTRKRGRATSVIPTFCPFCGEKYPRAGEEGETGFDLPTPLTPPSQG